MKPRPLPFVVSVSASGGNIATFSASAPTSLAASDSLTSDERIIKDIKKNNGPNNFLFTLGYAGWDKKQLDSEIKNGDWLILPVPENPQSIFSTNDDEKWDIYSSLVGMNLDDLSGKPGQA